MTKCNGIVANADISSPKDYGWTKDADGFSSVMTTMDPAPEAILQLVICAFNFTEKKQSVNAKVTSYNIPRYVVVETRIKRVCYEIRKCG